VAFRRGGAGTGPCPPHPAPLTGRHARRSYRRAGPDRRLPAWCCSRT